MQEFDVIEDIDEILEEATVISFEDITDEMEADDAVQLDEISDELNNERVVVQESALSQLQGIYLDITTNEEFEVYVDYNLVSIGSAKLKEDVGEIQIADNSDYYSAAWDTTAYLRATVQKKSEGPVDSVRIDKYDYGYKAGTQFVMVSGEFLASASEVDHTLEESVHLILVRGSLLHQLLGLVYT